MSLSCSTPLQSHLLSLQCSNAAPGYLAYQFRLRRNDEPFDDGDDAGDDAGNLIVRTCFGGDTTWYQYHAPRNEGAPSCAPHADNHDHGRFARNERFINDLVVGRLSPHLPAPEWTMLGPTAPRNQVLRDRVLRWDNSTLFCSRTQSQSQHPLPLSVHCCPLPLPPFPSPAHLRHVQFCSAVSRC
jgi:hypothetical protein